MSFDEFSDQLPDLDQQETQEWIEALRDVSTQQGPERASYVLRRLIHAARKSNIGVPASVSTPYLNTIAPADEPPFPGDEEMERTIRRLVRWNAAIMVLRANRDNAGIGGHLATYASAASLYEVGFNHFFQGHDHPGGADQIFFQGHAGTGVYARAFLEGRLTEQQLDGFRQESTGTGLSSYPHPKLMPDFWEFPTVSMGLGPLNAVYQARFNRYLQARGIKDTSGHHVWVFTGDGEMDEPESIAGLTLASRERLDNLIMVINCNLQRLDGPVRGNGKVIQEFESLFRGAGWNVIKVVWGREWDPLFAKDTEGHLASLLGSFVDGEYQKFQTETGEYLRANVFGRDPRVAKLVEDLSDVELRKLRRGGHDAHKLYAAYKAAVETKGQPTVILAKTVKGWMLGPDIQARNVTHQAKKMTHTDLMLFRDRLELQITDAQIDELPYYHPGEDSEVVAYLKDRRDKLGGKVPERRYTYTRPKLPPAESYGDFLEGADDTKVATTQVFVRVLRTLLRDKNIGNRVVPIIPDEARTFGMESLFKAHKIYNPLGQTYEAVDKESLLPYVESETGQVVEEGITEAGSMAMFTAAGTSYVTHSEVTFPFFIFYSMFGFQRIADLIWSFADQGGRGFLLGATHGRTTLNGEGLQHQDGHSLLIASTNPSCRSYDPAFAYEVAVIIRDGLKTMFEDEIDTFYYLTLYNEQYEQPAMPEGAQDGIIAGTYKFRASDLKKGPRVNLLASGPLIYSALSAQTTLAEKYKVAADVYSVTSYGQLRRQALDVERRNRLSPTDKPESSYVANVFKGSKATVAVSDSMKAVPDQIARWVPGVWEVLGTDGFGRSDTREQLRKFFEIDEQSIVVAALQALARAGEIQPSIVADALAANRKS